jgi:Spy/CpxP family protein refolding chaperone
MISKEGDMKRILWIALAVFLAVAGNAQANCGKCGMGDGPEAGMEMDMEKIVSEKIEKMAADLALTPEQQEQVKQIMQEKMERKRQIKEEKRAAMDALHKEVQAKMKAALTEEQLKKWEELKKDKPGMMGKCPHCEEGKMCPMCAKMKKEKGMEMGHEMDHEMEMEKGVKPEKGAEE